MPSVFGSLPMRILSLLLFVVLVLGIVSCSETRVSQCNRMNQVVNKISALPSPQDSQGWLRLSTQLSAIGAELKGLTFKDPVLANKQLELVKLTNEASQAAMELGKAIESQNNRERNRVITKIEELLKKEAPLVNEINQYCSS
jgi:hypothetical protein